MNLKKFICLGLLLSLVLTSACIRQNRDDLGLGGSPGQSYAEQFAIARASLHAGEVDKLKAMMGIHFIHEDGTPFTKDEVKEKIVATGSELSLMERGLIALNAGMPDIALFYFDAAQIKMEEVEAKSKASKNATKVGQGAWVAITGMEESQDYYLRGYEKVMIYNYKALCYMLQGDRKAYNVTRNAIDRQQEEWELFKEKLKGLEDESSKKYKEDEVVDASHVQTLEAFKDNDTRDEYTQETARLVPHAYVNPFGDYMNAVILEIDSIEERSMRNNAGIAYKKVLDNNPKCTTARNAVKEMKWAVPKGKKLVHVIVADGFAPERQVRRITLPISEIIASASYAEAVPQISPVKYISARYGKSNYNLSPLSNMEAIILRDDLDSKPFKIFMLSLAFARTIGAQLLAEELGAGEFSPLAGLLVGAMQQPDTRSWLSLPSKIMVARFYVPNSAKEISLRTYDEKRNIIAEEKVDLAPKGPSVVYAASYGPTLRTNVNTSSWIK